MDYEDFDFVLLNDSEVEDFNEHVEPLGASTVDSIRSWLKPTDYAASSSEYEKHRTSRLPGTVTWIEKTEQYQRWHNSAVGTLWIRAVAGTGKSVIVATMISKLSTEERVPVLYFFFRRTISTNLQPQSLVRDFMAQLLPYSPQLQFHLHSYLTQQRTIEKVSFEDLWNLLVAALLSLPQVYCIVDALDEMDDRHFHFIQALISLGERKPGTIKVLMSSRPMVQAEKSLQHGSTLKLDIQRNLVKADVVRYIEHRTATNQVSEALRSFIVETLSTKADGNFLYARLMLDELLDLRSSSDHDEAATISALQNLPLSLVATYTQMLQNHAEKSETSEHLQVAILQWATAAERPLRLLELSSLINVESLAKRKLADHKVAIRKACGPLLEVLEDETVCPIHHSLTEYLNNSARGATSGTTRHLPVFKYEVTHKLITISCIKLLKSGWHRNFDILTKIKDYGKQHEQQQQLRLEYPFLDYAADNWYRHFQKVRSDDMDAATEVIGFLTGDSDLLSAWLKVVVHSPTGLNWRTRANFATWTPLHAAALADLPAIIRHLVQKGADIEAKTSKNQTPLLVAAQCGNERAVETLIRLGASITQPDKWWGLPLAYAAYHDHHATVKLLLETGYEIFDPKTRARFDKGIIGDIAVGHACRNGYHKTMAVLLPYMPTERVYWALSQAWQAGQLKLAAKLITFPGLDPNYVLNKQTLLHLASIARDTKSIQILLDKGADINTKACSAQGISRKPNKLLESVVENNPLHALIATTHEYSHRWDKSSIMAGFEILLDAGIDINAVDSKGWTILHLIMNGNIRFNVNHTAIPRDTEREGVEEVLSMLFRRGLRATTLTPAKENALHLASNVSQVVIDLLINEGVGIDQSSGNVQTPLMTALHQSNLSIALTLINRGAQVRRFNRNGETPLHILTQNMDSHSRFGTLWIEVAKAMIAAGADIHAQNSKADTPLHVCGNKTSMLDLFLSNGFDIETKNDEGESVLFKSILASSAHSVYDKLLAAGADHCTRNRQGSNVLHKLLRQWHCEDETIKTLRYFIGKGVDPCEVDRYGNSLWHRLAEKRFPDHKGEAIMDLLIECGVPPLATNHAGQTPIHLASSLDVILQSSRHALLDYLLDHTNCDINVADHQGVRPIHTAVVISADLTCCLLNLDADFVAPTHDGQTPLMIACRARQCNTVSLLLDHYRKKEALSLINQLDQYNRSALHYACRSGHPESVELLLNAGADVNLIDDRGFTPLHICAEKQQEKVLWNYFDPHYPSKFATFVLLSNDYHPQRGDDNAESFRIRDTVRMLLLNGADTRFLIDPALDTPQNHNPLSLAIRSGYEAMVDELLLFKKFLAQSKIDGGDGGNGAPEITQVWYETLHHEYVESMHTTASLGIKVGGMMAFGQSNAKLVDKFLRADNEPALVLLHKMGDQFLKFSDENDDPLFYIAERGFTSLMRNVGREALELQDSLLSNQHTCQNDTIQARLCSLLAIAIDRECPNLQMVRLLVSEFGLDVRKSTAQAVRMAINYEPYIHASHYFLHRFAQPHFWWHTDALEFWLDQGCDIEALSTQGETALIVALRRSSGYLVEAMQLKVVKLLLEHGANPNTVGDGGDSCLQLAADKPQCTRLLLKYGADPCLGSVPPLFSAIRAENAETVRLLVLAGVDVNKRPQEYPLSDPSQLQPPLRTGDHNNGTITDPNLCSSKAFNAKELFENAYPIYAAASYFRAKHKDPKKAANMVRVLLDAGADPFMLYDNNESILQALVALGGVFEPFLEHVTLDLELRDHLGRTFLLAACDRRSDFADRETAYLPALLVHRGSSMVAVDNAGRNALHCLVSSYRRHSPSALSAMTEEFFAMLMPRTDHQGRTAFHYLLSHSAFDLLSIFLTHGADTKTPDPVDGTTVLHHLASALCNDRDTIFWDDAGGSFIVDDVDVGQEKENAQSQLSIRRKQATERFDTSDAFELARTRSPGHHFQRFLQEGFSINAQDKSGETPLFKFAAVCARNWIYPHLEFTPLPVLKLFEDAGADFKVRNLQGQSVLHLLAKASTTRPKDLQTAVKWLVSKGLDLNWEDSKSKTCLDVAAASGSQWMLDLFKRQ